MNSNLYSRVVSGNTTLGNRPLTWLTTLTAILFLCLGRGHAQQLELYSGSASTTAQGPTPTSATPATTLTATLFRNTGTSTTFSAFTPTTTYSVSISNEQYTTATYPGLTFGATGQAGTPPTLTGQAVFRPFDAIGSPLDTYFTSGPNSTAGANFDASTNYGYYLYTDAYYQVGQPLTARNYYADVTVTFSRPVINPVLHISGMGGAYNASGTPDTQGFYTELELSTANVSAGYTLTRLSGSSHFVLDGTLTKILNDATLKSTSTTAPYGSTQQNAGAGSVQINTGGAAITSVTFRVYLKGDGGTNTAAIWGHPTSSVGRAGDAWMISASLGLYTIDGTVYNDANGLTDNTIVSATALNGTSVPQSSGANIPLYASLVQNGSVLQTVPVTSTGTYSFTVADNDTYNVVLTTSSTGATTSTLPAGWVSTGENLGTGTGTDGTIDGIISVTVASANVVNANLGIERLPTAGTGTGTASNLGGTNPVTVPPAAFTTTTASSDVAPGSVSSIRLTAFPTNTTSLTINGTVYTASSTEFTSGTGVVVATTTSGAPTMPILVDPTNDSNPVVISFKAIDNAGKESTNTGTATITSSLAIALSGHVWNDIDGDRIQGGSEANTNAGGPLYVNLLNASNVVIASASVAADGTYSLTSVPANSTSLKLILAGTATATTPGGLPTGWLSTGESVGTGNTATQGNTVGYIELTTGSASITDQNFGIAQPSSVSVSCSETYLTDFGTGSPGTFGPPLPPGQATLLYTGGINAGDGSYAVVGSQFDFTTYGTYGVNIKDHTAGDGNGRFMSINARGQVGDIFFTKTFTGLTVGLTYSFSYWAARTSKGTGILSPNVGYQLINPANAAVLASGSTGSINTDGWRQVTNTFTATTTSVQVKLYDLAGGNGGNDLGLDDISFGATNCPITVSGTVWNDADGNLALNGSESGTNTGGTLYVNLLNTSNTVVGSTTVAVDGTYSLTALGSTTGYKLVVATTATSATPGLPTSWTNTGEVAGTNNAATQGTTLGLIELTTSTSAVTGANFGIEQLPTPGSGSAVIVNLGGTSAVTVPPAAFTSTAPSTDTAPGSVTAIRITVFPTNTTSLTVNGAPYTTLPAGGILVPTDGNGAPTVPILVNPTNDANPVVITFVAVDNAGKSATTTGTATISPAPLYSISGTVYNDANALTDNTVNGSAVNGTAISQAGGSTVPLYASLLQNGSVIRTVAVSSTGIYSFSVADNGPYTVVLTTNSAGSTAATLPTGWISTGENIGTGTGTDGTVDGILTVNVSSANVANANFGIAQPFDYGDTPISYEANSASASVPARNSASSTLRINTIPDEETAALSVASAADNNGNNGDGADEDGTSSPPPSITKSAAYVLPVTVSNTSGTARTLHGWIDFNNNGRFEVGEYQSVNVPTGTNGTVNLSWTTTQTNTGSAGKSYMRLRLAGATLADNAGTSAVDERSIADGLSTGTYSTFVIGEVEDYQVSIGNTDIEVFKQGPVTANPNGTINYTIHVANYGPGAVSNVVVSDPAVANVNVTAITCFTAGGGSSGVASCPTTTNVASLQAGTMTIPSLPNGSSVLFFVTATATGSIGSQINNTITATLPSGSVDSDPTNNSATLTTTIVDAACSGSQTTYTLDGQATANANTVSPNCGTINLVYNLTGGTAIPGIGSSFTIPYQYSDLNSYNGTDHQWMTTDGYGGAIGNSYHIYPATADANGALVTGSLYNGRPTNNQQQETSNGSGVDAQISGYLQTGAIDQEGTFNVTIGTYPAAPTGYSVVSKTLQISTLNNMSTNGNGNNQGGFLTKFIDEPRAFSQTNTPIMDIEYGRTYDARYTAFSNGTIYPQSGTIARGVHVRGSVTYVNNTGCADLAITQTGSTTALPNGTVSYTLVITNAGSSSANGATILDPAVANLTAANVTCAGTAGSAVCPVSPTVASLQAGTLAIPTFPSGGSVTLVVTGTAGASGTITNVASVSAPVGIKESVTTNNSSTAVTTIIPQVLISGTVYNDPNGGTIDGTATNVVAGNTFYVSTTDPTTGNVISTTAVQPDGTYSLTATANTSYSVVLSNAPQTVGQPVSATVLTGAANTAEGTTPTGDGTPNGKTPVSVVSSNVTGVNFGIDPLPTAGSGTNTVSNAGGTTPVPVPTTAFTNGGNSTDTAPGSVTAIRITTFPSNVTSLTINGTVYTASSPEFTGGTPPGVVVPTDGSGNPIVPIAVDPTNDGLAASIPFKAIDNAGKESANTGTATLNSTLLTSIAGTVWNDADGNLALNGLETGTNTGTTLYVNLVDGAGTVVGSTTVAANGTYTLLNVPTNISGYKLVLTNSATSTTPGPLPIGWVNTGESVGSGNTATQSATLGQIDLTIGTAAVIAQNFGIEQLPAPGNGSATVANAGGTSPVTVPPSAFTSTSPSTDTAPGSVTAIRITTFPSNVTSLTINGTVYTSTSPEFTGSTPTGVVVPTNGSGSPGVPILADPTTDANPVIITFAAIDNAGKESTTTGTATINSTLTTTIAGNVLDDGNGLTDGIVSTTGTGALTPVNGTSLDGVSLYATLVNSGGTSVTTVAVNSTGGYLFTGVPAGTYSVVLSTNSSGSLTPSLPASWTNVGEHLGAGSGSDASANGILTNIVVGTVPVTDANFGIDKTPVVVASTDSPRVNPGGSATTPVSSTVFSGSDPEDGTYTNLSGRTVTLTPATNGTLYYNGTAVNSTTAITGFNPTLISLDPDATGATTGAGGGSPDPTFTYSVADNAGVASTPQTISIPFTAPLLLSGTVFNDPNGLTNSLIDGTPTNVVNGNTLYVSTTDPVSGNVISTTAVAGDGTYSLPVTANTSYSVVLSNAPQTVGQPVSATLLTGAVNTAEGTSPTGDGTPNGKTPVSVVSSNVTGVNFGIDPLPTAGSGANTANNAGGTTSVAVPISTFSNGGSSTDTAPGSVTAIRITAFPSNTTSLTVDGSIYNSGNFPGSGVVVPTDGNGNPSVPIAVDPTNDANSVVIAFVAVDNAGKESTNTGTATINSTLVTTLSGTVWNDADGSLSLNGSETGTNTGSTLYVNLVDGAGTVVGSTTVATDGTYSLINVPTNVTGYKLVLTNSATSTTPGPLPTGWVNTGESVGSGNTATQSATLGQIEVTIGTSGLAAQNFGIEVLPSVGSGSATASNAGSTSPVSVPPSAFTSTSPSTDTAPGSVTAIRITTFPGNVTSLTINGSVYTSGNFPGSGVIIPTDGNGAPTQPIVVDPSNDANPVVIAFVAVDNAGKESANTGTATISSSPVITVSGQVWNDVDGSLTLNGSETGTNTGATLYVNVVDGVGSVVASTTVATDGSYSLSGVPANVTGYKLVLTNSASSTTPGTLPTGWVNTGEQIDPSNTATQSTTPGQIELTTGSGAVTAQNFGIEQLPNAGAGNSTVSNAGGTSPVTVPAGTFTNNTPSTDTAPGSVTAIRISSFPGNVTSLTINGTTYTTGTFPSEGVVIPTDGSGNPSTPILVDPTNDANPVVITFMAVDNAGKESANTGTATISSTPVVTISGSVWNDADGNVSLNGSETGTNTGGTLYVNLIDGTGTVVGSTTVNTNGTYTLAGIPASATGLKLVLTNSATSTTPGPLPTGWVNTGENVDPSNSATQSATLGQIELTTGTGNVTNQNFGIEQLPSAGSGTTTASNAGGTSPVTVPPSAFTATNPSTDTAPGSVTAIRISSFPGNVTSLTINGSVYTSGNFPGSGVVIPTDGSGAPTVPVLVDPTNDANPVVLPFVAIDNAGKESTNTGTATINSSLVVSVSGTVWNDADGNLSLNGVETGTNTGATLYVNLVDGANTVVSSTTVAADGSYTLTGIPANVTGYKLVLTSSASSNTPGTLPTGWVNTGESVGGSNPAGQTSTLGQIELTTGTTAVTAQNFGIEQTPTPGSGSATAGNAGGTSPVTVPPTAFTSTSSGADTAPGSVTAIRITAFPGNVTSLTVNGTTYTSLPAGGIIVPTTSTGAPTVPILVDPTNDANPVSFSFVAVDNAGKESTATGTATISSAGVPDLSPVIYARSSTIYGTKPITVVVEVYELNGVATAGPITVKLSKDPKVSLSFGPTATSVGGQAVSNSAWSFEDVLDDDYYVLTTNQVIGAGGLLPFGLSGTLTPGATSGTLTFTTVIGPGSGGEVLITNNTDADKIDFFQQ